MFIIYYLEDHLSKTILLTPHNMVQQHGNNNLIKLHMGEIMIAVIMISTF